SLGGGRRAAERQTGPVAVYRLPPARPRRATQRTPHDHARRSPTRSPRERRTFARRRRRAARERRPDAAPARNAAPEPAGGYPAEISKRPELPGDQRRDGVERDECRLPHPYGAEDDAREDERGRS